MRNLRNIGHSVFRPDDARAPITATCWDVAGNDVLITCGPSPSESDIELYRLSRDERGVPSKLQVKESTRWPASSGNDAIRSLHHLSDTNTTCVVMAGGDIITVTEDDRDGELQAMNVGTLDSPVLAARWSPDQELLVIVTSDNKVFFMSRNFDVITETTMTAEDLGASKHVSVGWGKKETQFQGKGAKAKALRDPTIPEKVDVGALSAKDDGRCTISWRGDGAYVAINSVQEGARRVIRVYNREGELDSVSEPVDNLEGALSWRPEGNLVAGIQRLGDGRVDVVFFERNGLRHGQFTIRAPPEAVAGNMALEWNADSTVLAVIFQDRIQLWTVGNYHWYLKQEILISGATDQTHLPSFSWHGELPLDFAVASADKVVRNECMFTVARGPATPPYDHGAVAVIDGQTVKFTPFRTANVPPPMAMFEIELESPATDISFANDGSAMAVLHRLGVNLYALDTQGTRSCKPRLLDQVLFEELDSKKSHEKLPLQLSLSGQQEIQVLYMADDVRRLSYNFDTSSPASRMWLQADAHLAGTFVSSEGVSQDGSIIQDYTGSLSLVSGEESTSLELKLPAFLPWTSVVSVDSQLLAFGLSRNGHLYANSRQLAKNCTSFLVTPSHLVFTTSNHLVKFVHLCAAAEDLDVPLDDPENDERCRSIERGARLVTAMPTKMSLVLQMPRGNLEIIFPRAMVLAGIRQLIEQKDYGGAFSTCRTQRVDMNILYDHRPEQFLGSVGLFLEQVGDAANIDLFLSALKEEDVTQTMYRDTTKNTSTAQVESTLPGKVNKVCDAVLQRLLASKNANLQNIITAHVCKVPPALDDGLLVVADLMKEDEALAERAVEHICFLADVNRLFDRALGLYDLELTLLVAQQSQRDPREYLPFIQELHKMPALQRQFAIDDRLEHREKALNHLKAIGDFEEVRKYVVRYDLYQRALQLYRHDAEHHRIMVDAYAAYLKTQSEFREAGLAYESLKNFSDATDCYLKAGAACWRECLFTAQLQQPPISSSKLREIASTLADALREAKDYSSAATIHLDYLSSVGTAIWCLCKGYLFNEALRLVSLHKREDLLESDVDPGLVEAFSSSTEFLADCKEQLKAQVPRILELRKKAKEDPLAFYEGENPYGRNETGEIPDDVSIAASSRISTSASLFTRYTGKQGSVGTVGSNVSRATSKNRRREEKKRARGRKGTVYEEEYLVNSVRRLVERVEGGTKGEVERLVAGLMRRDMSERARAVEELLGQVVDACRVAVEQVWPQTRNEGLGVNSGNGGDMVQGEGAGDNWRPSGGDAVLYDALQATTGAALQKPPVLTAFERLSLLGGK
ncbi:IKI3 family-domain-containing protein [Diplogelasinospora grovesii]|uniref:Elongator complex protein 1 n=1 Tax=Diplogelasinospora grovesii TaxID=303347 RepID=A0AAN6NMJ7_9PEZI|nr:IKI3 family-domain-containing protein [Diplogelasinospora grovesii]